MLIKFTVPIEECYVNWVNEITRFSIFGGNVPLQCYFSNSNGEAINDRQLGAED